ncbi:DNA alkylation repair protein [Nakamurella sp. YIM 132087]|uniref:DNA alkylation repair protein n=1 Tax=Nakamurella alba TaxID=2665158 RepID=A0A7K1FQI1_9ACTN|nr:DNA alkylation repair protein [Nakamurella alba]MTD16330.1 DNA alkylation repair protein [Nakamurella alba]
MPFADELLGAPAARSLLAAVRKARPRRRLQALTAAVTGLDGLTLRARCDLLTAALLDDIPGDDEDLGEVVRRLLADPAFTGWATWPVGEAVTARALEQLTTDAIDRALDLLPALTPLLSSEFAIRPLMIADLPRVIAAAVRWTADPDPAVRRLASEGTRPYLPWARRVPALDLDPAVTVPILDALYRDPDEVVRRSVANHLNDLSRQHPELVVATAAGWAAAPDVHTPRVVRHALRTLVKRGHPDALALLGFGAGGTVVVTGPVLRAGHVQDGGEIAFTGSILNPGAESVRVAVDYVLHFRKASGRTAPKVFKITTATLAPGEQLDLARTFSFRPITTRRYHPGEHALELQVNGVASGRVAFVYIGQGTGAV